MMSFMYPEAAGLKHGWNDSFWEGAGLGDLVTGESGSISWHREHQLGKG